MAAIGIWALGRICFDALMDDSCVWTVICACGDGVELECTVRWLLHRTRSRRVVLVDCGLDDRGKNVANYLAEQDGKISFYTSFQEKIWEKEAGEWLITRR